MEIVYGGLIIIGIINGVKLAELPDKRSFYYFLLALALGIVFGFLGMFGIRGVEAGIVLALQSSGLYKLVKIA